MFLQQLYLRNFSEVNLIGFILRKLSCIRERKTLQLHIDFKVCHSEMGKTAVSNFYPEGSIYSLGETLKEILLYLILPGPLNIALIVPDVKA